MKVKFKKLHEDAVLPKYAHSGDAGMDVTAVSDANFVFCQDKDAMWYYIEYKTGLALELESGYVALLFPRSSISKSSLYLCNAVGVVDSSYKNEICFRFRVDATISQESDEKNGKPAFYKKGDRIGQMMIVPYPTIETEWTEELSESARTGGFGSTGA